MILSIGVNNSNKQIDITTIDKRKFELNKKIHIHYPIEEELLLDTYQIINQTLKIINQRK